MNTALLLLLTVFLLFLKPELTNAQTAEGEKLPISEARPELLGDTNRPFGRYRPQPQGATNFNDSPRIDNLIRGGNIYLSLPDAISLAIENNLDVELQRLTPLIAESDIKRAQAGNSIRGVPLNVQEGPSGLVSGGGTQASGVQSIGGTTSTNTQTQNSNFNNNTNSATVQSTSTQSSASGPGVPLLDPSLIGSFGWNRTNRPQTNSFITGTTSAISNTSLGNIGVQKGFLLGGTASLSLDANRQNTNNARSEINPTTTGGLAFSFTQPLLRGFGVAVNNRFIRIARNNRQVSDLAFEQQLISTVYAVTRLYWDLVGLAGEARVARQSLELAERLLTDNVNREEAGTLAPVEVVRARAQVATARRDLTVAETRLRQQETILKDYLIRGNIDSSRLLSLRLLPTENMQQPANEPVQPLQDLVSLAAKRRPDVLQANLQVQNSRISLSGSRSALLPSLDLNINARSNALYGQVNTLPGPDGNPIVRQPDPGFIGGTGAGFSQIFNGRFPDYGAQISLNIPILNRTAQADYARDAISVRQQEIRQRQLDKQVRVDVVNALIAVEQSRAALEASQQARVLQQQSLEAEQEKFAVGASTNYLVIQYQRDLSQAQSAEVVALADYVKAKANLDRSTGTLLDRFNIAISEAYRGKISQAPATLPPVTEQTP